jgi:DNA repair protein RadC
MSTRNRPETVKDRNGEDPEYRIVSQRMCDIPSKLRPREQFDLLGAEHVPDATLLALILRTGLPGLNVADLAQRLLQRYHSLTALARCSVQELVRIEGVGPVKAQMLKAALELGRRLSIEAVPEDLRISSPEDVTLVLRERVRLAETEILWALLLDTRNRLMRPPLVITKGTLNASLAHPREVFREAIRAACAAIVLAHNHPSGDPSPSAEDVTVTRQIVETGKVVGIHVVDHVILGRRQSDGRLDYASMRESGLVKF